MKFGVLLAFGVVVGVLVSSPPNADEDAGAGVGVLEGAGLNLLDEPPYTPIVTPGWPVNDKMMFFNVLLPEREEERGEVIQERGEVMLPASAFVEDAIDALAAEFGEPVRGMQLMFGRKPLASRAGMRLREIGVPTTAEFEIAGRLKGGVAWGSKPAWEGRGHASSLVRIVGPFGMGTGSLVQNRDGTVTHVLTCAHVITDEKGPTAGVPPDVEYTVIAAPRWAGEEPLRFTVESADVAIHPQYGKLLPKPGMDANPHRGEHTPPFDVAILRVADRNIALPYPPWPLVLDATLPLGPRRLQTVDSTGRAQVVVQRPDHVKSMGFGFDEQKQIGVLAAGDLEVTVGQGHVFYARGAIRNAQGHKPYTLQGDSGGPAFRIAHAGLPESSSVLVQTGIVEYGIPDGPEEHPFKCGFVPTAGDGIREFIAQVAPNMRWSDQPQVLPPVPPPPFPRVATARRTDRGLPWPLGF